MKRVQRLVWILAALAGCLFATPVLAQDGSAEGRVSESAFTQGRVSMQVTAGFGFAAQGDSLRNPYNVSLGAQAGYTMGPGLYLGAMADYFAGDSEIVAGARFDEQLELSYDWSHMALDVGYDVRANQLVVRPTVAVGAAILGSCLANVCESDTYLMVAPGVTALGQLGKRSFFSFTLRYFLIPGGKRDPEDGAMFGVGFGAVL